MSKQSCRFQGFLLTVFLAVTVSFICASVTWSESPVWGKDISPVDISSEKINPDRVIARFKQGISKNTIDAILAQQGLRLEKTLRHTGVSILKVVDKGKSIKRILKDLDASGIVEYAEPDYLLHADVTPNDPRFGELWGLHNTGQSGGTPDADIDAPEAWDTATGSADVVVAVIDTGVDYNHEDLAANMWTNPGEIPANGVDDDGNGYVDDVYGIDPCNGDSDPFDDNGHGTHCSGTIGAVSDNGIGVVGVNWDVRIMALKFLSASGGGYTSDAIECLEYGIMMETDYGINLKLTSNSWGGGGFSQSLYDAIEASGNAGMLFVAAAGNSGSNNDINPHYPSSYDLANIIAVAATDRDDDLAYFSCYGPQSVDMCAPGQDILSTTPGNSYSIYSGTSMATPHVSGAAALLWSINPSYGHSDTKSTLLCTVDPLASLAGMVLTGGRLNLDNAINCDPFNPQLIPSLEEGFSVDQGVEQVLTARLSACVLLRGADVTADFSNGDPRLSLLDDGVEPDQTADDGIYTAAWIPEGLGPVTVTFNAVHEGNTYSEVVNGDVVAFSGYYYDDAAPFDWIDISSTGTALGLSDDDYTYFSIPFTVTFYDQEYDHIAVGSNGQVYFEDNYLGWSNKSIPSDTGHEVNRFLAGLWDDLNPGSGGEIYCEVLGSAPERRLVIQFEGVPHYSNIGAVSFEIIFHENSEQIMMQYLDVDFGNSSYDYGASATVGVQRESEFGQQYSYNEPALHNEMAIRWYREAGPMAGFSATPTTGTAPLAVNFTDLSTGSIADWAWNFGDGQTSTEQNPSHIYDTPGTYTVSLTVTGPGGTDTETKIDYITVTASLPDVSVTLAPDDTVIPRGGTLGVGVTITNNTNEAQIIYFATNVTLPNGNIYPPSGYLFGPFPIALNPHQSKSGHLSHTIPGNAPIGAYTYHGYVGKPGEGVIDEDQFDFEVTGPSVVWPEDWETMADKPFTE